MGIEMNCLVLQNYRKLAFYQNSQRRHGRKENTRGTATRKRASLGKDMGNVTKMGSVAKR